MRLHLVHTRNVCVNKNQRVCLMHCKVHLLMKFWEHSFGICMVDIAGDYKQIIRVEVLQFTDNPVQLAELLFSINTGGECIV